MGRRFAVIVVGGGILGVSVAYWLARLGEPSVALFEARQLSAGATGRAAGFVTPQLWNPLDIELVKLSADEFGEQDSTQPLVRQVGLVTLADAGKSGRALERLHQRLVAAGIPARLIDAREIHALLPNIRTGERVAACYDEFSGYVNPTPFVEARAREASGLGVTVYAAERVQRILAEDGHVTGVGVKDKAVEADEVVIAGGAWSGGLLRTVGVELPLKAYRTWAALLQTAWSPAAPMLHDTLLDFYVRPEGTDKVFFGDGTELRESDPDRVHDAPSWEFRTEVAAKFGQRFPVATGAAITSGWSGVDTATPDRFPLLGAVPGKRGLYIGTGMQGMGIMRGPALGRCVAHMLLRKRAPLDVSAYAPARFSTAADFPIQPGFTLD
jgi:glycine/D-amino acid oxidase-like deaminating enzyme